MVPVLRGRVESRWRAQNREAINAARRSTPYPPQTCATCDPEFIPVRVASGIAAAGVESTDIGRGLPAGHANEIETASSLPVSPLAPNRLPTVRGSGHCAGAADRRAPRAADRAPGGRCAGAGLPGGRPQHDCGRARAPRARTRRASASRTGHGRPSARRAASGSPCMSSPPPGRRVPRRPARLRPPGRAEATGSPGRQRRLSPRVISLRTRGSG